MRWIVAASLALAACGEDRVPPDRSVEEPGEYAVATTRYVIPDGTRPLTVQAWAPTDAVAADVAIAQLEPVERQATYEQLLADAPACPTRTLPVAVDAVPAAGPFPVVVLSHCHGCTRLSNASTAVRLASHGFVVLAVDHATNTLWDDLAGTGISLDPAFLATRAADVQRVIDELPSSPVAGSVDIERLGVLGHSFGAVTAGRVAQIDPRVKAAVALAAPVENPLIPGVALAEIGVPLMFVVAVEDNSITEFGNIFMRNNFRDAPVPAWKIEVADAGHWSVSDLNGLVDAFAAGCGDGVRQTDGEAFTYLDPVEGRARTATFATAFFEMVLTENSGAEAFLADVAMAEHHD